MITPEKDTKEDRRMDDKEVVSSHYSSTWPILPRLPRLSLFVNVGVHGWEDWEHLFSFVLATKFDTQVSMNSSTPSTSKYYQCASTLPISRLIYSLPSESQRKHKNLSIRSTSHWYCTLSLSESRTRSILRTTKCLFVELFFFFINLLVPSPTLIEATAIDSFCCYYRRRSRSIGR